jgi:hypothetical protein
MEPVFMVLGQSAGVAACMAIDGNTSVQNVDVARLRKKLANDPLLNGSVPEIMVDDTNIDKIKRRGAWSKRFGNNYKLSYMFCPEAKEGVFFSFLPHIKKAGFYRVYFYCTALSPSDTPKRLAIDIQTVSGIREVVFEPQRIEEKDGQTGSYWKDLGVYDFPEGQSASITVNGGKSTGPLFADAILLIKE